MGKYKDERAATEFENDAGSTTGGALKEVSMARRSFLGRIARWSGALAVSGLGAETWMQAVSKRSVMSSAMAAGAPRDRQLHPFPSDDTFNMPLGINASYAPTSDAATKDITDRGAGFNMNNGWSYPVYFPTTADLLHTFTWVGNPNRGVQSYREDEENQPTLQEHLRSDATASEGSWNPARNAYTSDRHLLIIKNNDLVENFGWHRESPTTARASRIVRNRLDHYAHAGGSNPLRNRAGVRAWGGSAIAGLIRKHEVETNNPHIPHALAGAVNRFNQLGTGSREQGNTAPHGDPNSPLYLVRLMFPANAIDNQAYTDSTGSCRMGMRFAMDPTIVTDEFLNNITNVHTRALVRALRDYGMILTDANRASTTLYGEQGIDNSLLDPLRNWRDYKQYMRRVAGRVSGNVIHNPGESDWNTWRANGEGWGGGAPRVPYSPPLSSAVPPQSPGKIEVTESRRFGDTA